MLPNTAPSSSAEKPLKDRSTPIKLRVVSCLLVSVLLLPRSTRGDYKALYQFSDPHNGNPFFGPLLVSPNVMYGMVAGDETFYNSGLIFQLNNDGSGFTAVHKFDGG